MNMNCKTGVLTALSSLKIKDYGLEIMDSRILEVLSFPKAWILG
jgi:hypothetical protein